VGLFHHLHPCSGFNFPCPSQAVSAKSIVPYNYLNILFTPVQFSCDEFFVNCTIVTVTYRILGGVACVASSRFELSDVIES
jgi:hypothetical protein